jgi:hypothetical protein
MKAAGTLLSLGVLFREEFKQAVLAFLKKNELMKK